MENNSVIQPAVLVVEQWSAWNEITLEKDKVYLLRKRSGFSIAKNKYEYALGRYAGKLETKWNGKQDALWVEGESRPQEPSNYEYCELQFPVEEEKQN